MAKTVYTRTLSFKITAATRAQGHETRTAKEDYSQQSMQEWEKDKAVGEQDSLFEWQLKSYLAQEQGNLSRAGVREIATDTAVCSKFLSSLGGLTHYVSSVTLGAMEYSVKKSQVESL